MFDLQRVLRNRTVDRYEIVESDLQVHRSPSFLVEFLLESELILEKSLRQKRGLIEEDRYGVPEMMLVPRWNCQNRCSFPF